MAVTDIRAIKRKLREEVKVFRRSLTPEQKAQLDEKIKNHLLRVFPYKRAKTVLVYMSTAIEVDTSAIISQALSDGKQVALPRCVDGTRLMDFYYIRSFDDLEKGTFGVLEPKTTCQKLTSYPGSVCIVPALGYDKQGFRLGYGGGYYDRFLGGYTESCIGLIYGKNLYGRLPHGRYDRPVRLLITERGFFYPRANRHGG